MATLLQIHSLVSGTPELELRFKAARLEAAWDVLNEAPETSGHTERLAWANGIIADYDGANQAIEYRTFLSNATIQTSGANSTDNDIQYVVNSFINIWAGVA